MDKPPVIFSKKHLIMAGSNLQDFYIVKTKKPMSENSTFISVQISTSDPNKLTVTPNVVRLSM